MGQRRDLHERSGFDPPAAPCTESIPDADGWCPNTADGPVMVFSMMKAQIRSGKQQVEAEKGMRMGNEYDDGGKRLGM
jgi:hypothetical protein